MSAQIWLHSDWHWKHENIYTFVDASGQRIRARFANMTEGDAYIEQRIRDLVKEQDHIYYLGDLTMFRENHMAAEFVKLFKSLPGHKRLVPGNHDHLKPKWYVEAGFTKIRGSHLHDGLLMTHFPVHPSSIGFRVVGNVHGHTHQQPDLGPKYLNVSVERTDYEPIPIEEAKKRFVEKQLTQPISLDVSGHVVTGP